MSIKSIHAIGIIIVEIRNIGEEGDHIIYQLDFNQLESKLTILMKIHVLHFMEQE